MFLLLYDTSFVLVPWFILALLDPVGMTWNFFLYLQVGNALFLLALEMMISALRMTSPHGMNATVM